MNGWLYGAGGARAEPSLRPLGVKFMTFKMVTLAMLSGVVGIIVGVLLTLLAGMWSDLKHVQRCRELALEKHVGE